MIECSCLLFAVLAGCVGGDAEPPPPNFVLIVADDLGYGDLGCYGGETPTPALDRMASEGLRFTDFHSSGTVCSPTRAGLMTGLYQQRVGVPGVVNADPKHPAHATGLDPSATTFSDVLSDVGYATALFGKWHLGYHSRFNPRHHSFDEFRGYVSGNIDYVSHYDRMETYDWYDGTETTEEEGYVTELITEHAERYLDQRAEDGRPFCLVLAHEAVHSPWQGPDDGPIRGPNKGPAPDRPKAETYALMLQSLDRSVGAVLEKLRSHELAENTLVVFFSDNGGTALSSNGPLRGRKGSVWEGGHRVPCLAWWPGVVEAGGESDRLTMSFDLMPTMLDLAHCDVPAKQDGMSLRSLLRRPTMPWPERELVWRGEAIRRGPWKLVQVKGEKKLFDLSADLGESNDLAGDRPELVAELTARLETWRNDVNGTP